MTALFSCANFPVGAQMFGFHIVLRLRTIYLVVVQLCFYAFYEFYERITVFRIHFCKNWIYD